MSFSASPSLKHCSAELMLRVGFIVLYKEKHVWAPPLAKATCKHYSMLNLTCSKYLKHYLLSSWVHNWVHNRVHNWVHNRVHSPVHDIVLGSFDPKPSSDFSLWLWDKIWEWSGDEAITSLDFILLRLSHRNGPTNWFPCEDPGLSHYKDTSDVYL